MFRIEIDGLNFARKINVFTSNGIRLKKVRLSGRKATFSVSRKDYKKFDGICKEIGVTATVVSGKTDVFTLVGKLVGAVLSVLIFFTFQSFSFGVKVSVDDEFSSGKIYDFLAERGYTSVLPKSQVNTPQLKKDIMENFGVGVLSVDLVGSYISVVGKSEKQVVPIFFKPSLSPVVSKYDGVVTRIVLLDGTAVCKVGKAVMKNDVLIAPFTTVNECETPSFAGGCVYGKIYVEKSVFVPETHVETVRTGKVQKTTVLDFFGVKNEVTTDFEFFEVERKKISLCDFLPIYAEMLVYYETEQVEVRNDEKKSLESAVSHCKSLILSEFPEDCAVLQYFTAIKKCENGTKVTVTAEIETVLSQ